MIYYYRKDFFFLIIDGQEDISFRSICPFFDSLTYFFNVYTLSSILATESVIWILSTDKCLFFFLMHHIHYNKVTQKQRFKICIIYAAATCKSCLCPSNLKKWDDVVRSNKKTITFQIDTIILFNNVLQNITFS